MYKNSINYLTIQIIFITFVIEMNEKQKDEFAKFYFDLAKLVFAGVVLFNITEVVNPTKLIIVISGIISIIAFVIIGKKYLK